ncbi:hypothetical protein KO481_29890 [Nocardia sp. NEAU-G5]|uniref:Uncharacterized protein n=1 Tax=Nocardia albiluteola TaxID=2842303 RepID=A0ABS6B8H1_9NOCA|nr:hypothetical protein [Nocardia albiluteola]MBU3065726.1 hypothetical protein [Nocardia albiluteola]
MAPERNSLIVALNEKREDPCTVPWALFSATNRRYGIADGDDQGSRRLFKFGEDSPFQVLPWPEPWLALR